QPDAGAAAHALDGETHLGRVTRLGQARETGLHLDVVVERELLELGRDCRYRARRTGPMPVVVGKPGRDDRAGDRFATGAAHRLWLAIDDGRPAPGLEDRQAAVEAGGFGRHLKAVGYRGLYVFGRIEAQQPHD